MPAEGVEAVSHSAILRLEEFERVVAAAAAIGISKYRITGGEPLVRKGLLSFIRNISQIPGVDDIAMTTNGILLAEYARPLKEAGLRRVNISLDTLDREKFARITRFDRLDQVLKGIDAALEVGLHPVKINTVVIRGFNEDMLLRLAKMTRIMPIHVRFIEFMPIGDSDMWSDDKVVPVQEMKEIIEQMGILTPVQSITGCGPARYYQFAGALGTIGFISPISEHFCHQCNRLRLTADGKLRPCLLSDYEVDIKQVLRKGATQEQLIEILRLVIQNKPEAHHLNETKEHHYHRTMSEIGG